MGEFVGTGDLNNIPLRSAISLSALLCKPKGSVVASNALPRYPLKGEELKTRTTYNNLFLFKGDCPQGLRVKNSTWTQTNTILYIIKRN